MNWPDSFQPPHFPIWSRIHSKYFKHSQLLNSDDAPHPKLWEGLLASSLGHSASTDQWGATSAGSSLVFRPDSWLRVNRQTDGRTNGQTGDVLVESLRENCCVSRELLPTIIPLFRPSANLKTPDLGASSTELNCISRKCGFSGSTIPNLGLYLDPCICICTCFCVYFCICICICVSAGQKSIALAKSFGQQSQKAGEGGF